MADDIQNPASALALSDPSRLLLPAVLLIEDDERLGAMTQEMLSEDFQVSWARTGAEARALLSGSHYDALVVDRRLPDMDGLRIVRDLRAAGMTTPALMLTALAEVDDIVAGLDGGANDYLTKPFHFAELQARLHAMLRGFAARTVTIAIGDWMLDTVSSRIEDPDGRGLTLTRAQVALLATLAASPNHVFSREELLREVFDDASEPNTVDVYVSYIRGKTTRSIIETVRGRGYRIGSPEAD
ncbi:response regulator transcription factor [Bifidobacterium eulemuris]|uniref:Response regulator transcription factor n=1 Tax=Bifidobacterium eulemuris TaxID=1765219 RepID=A0A261G8L8_9BIFI|nr:response regulator transcription factor [Bifidobacterium eulemuris]OZG67535.1 two-component response regulator [Bifidobacterium eulemuris]QOL31072.1 response regulator transcription factor [Bifidobacterium eulemuris]